MGISIGIAPNRYIAKIASGLKKPDGLVVVEEGGEADFMLALPLGKLWGAGEKTQERFAELGIRTVAQLATMSEIALASLFGKAGGPSSTPPRGAAIWACSQARPKAAP